MDIAGKSKTILVEGVKLCWFNQRCKAWTHPYPYQGRGDLSTSGCGIFSLCHCAQWLTGQVQSPEQWADFSVKHGGRGDDGTDRPALLHALMAQREAKHLGFRYEEDGLRNDLPTLYDMLRQEAGVAMCNLRVGHIVSLVKAREVDGVRQVLVIDSVSESASDKVRDHVLEVVPAAEVHYDITNAAGLHVGDAASYAAFWVDAALPRDFNLLHRI